MRDKFDSPGLKFVVMNSFSTSADTMAFFQEHHPELAQEAEDQFALEEGTRPQRAWNPSVCDSIRRLERRVEKTVHAVSAALRSLP